MRKNNLTTQDVNLLTDGGVPEDCELLLFNQPTSDLSADELEQVEHFMVQGGQVMVILSSETDAASFPNLNSLTTSYGISILEGALADQANFYQYFGSAYIFFPTLSTSDSITSGLSADSYVMVGYDGTNQVSPAIPPADGGAHRGRGHRHQLPDHLRLRRGLCEPGQLHHRQLFRGRLCLR